MPLPAARGYPGGYAYDGGAAAMMGYGAGWGWGWLYGALLLIGLALLVVVALRLLGGGVRREPPRDQRDRARHLLDERYARGEIDTEEYQARRRVLGDGG